MAKKKRRIKKPTITEQRRKRLLRAVKRSEGYDVSVTELIQAASPQKIASLSKNRNKNLHKLSTVRNPETALKAREKEIRQLRKRQEMQRAKEAAEAERSRLETEEWIKKVNEYKDQRQEELEEEYKFRPDLSEDEKEKEREEKEKDDKDEEEPLSYFDAIDVGDVIYNNVQDWIQSQSKKGKGRTGEHLNNAFDDLINKYGKSLVFGAMGNISDDVQDLCEKMVYYDGSEANLEAARSSFYRAIETMLTFMEYKPNNAGIYEP